jgi:hypothetical protein
MRIARGKPPYRPRFEHVTGDFIYIKLHDAHELYVTGFAAILVSGIFR